MKVFGGFLLNSLVPSQMAWAALSMNSLAAPVAVATFHSAVNRKRQKCRHMSARLMRTRNPNGPWAAEEGHHLHLGSGAR